jgi:hypothetical protein
MLEETVSLSLSFDYPGLSVTALTSLLEQAFTAAGFRGAHRSAADQGVLSFRHPARWRRQRCTVMLEPGPAGARAHLAGTVPLTLVNTVRPSQPLVA